MAVTPPRVLLGEFPMWALGSRSPSQVFVGCGAGGDTSLQKTELTGRTPDLGLLLGKCLHRNECETGLHNLLPAEAGAWCVLGATLLHRVSAGAGWGGGRHEPWFLAAQSLGL